MVGVASGKCDPRYSASSHSGTKIHFRHLYFSKRNPVTLHAKLKNEKGSGEMTCGGLSQPNSTERSQTESERAKTLEEGKSGEVFGCKNAVDIVIVSSASSN